MDNLENPAPCRLDAEKARDTIQKIAEELGFDLAGAIEVKSEKGRGKSNKLDEWIKNGYCADMKWFADSLDKRKDILKVMPDAKSVICVAMNYYNGRPSFAKATEGKIARYAQGRDYHKIFDKKLKIFAQKLKEILPNSDFKY